jgi:hypothetical protein
MINIKISTKKKLYIFLFFIYFFEKNQNQGVKSFWYSLALFVLITMRFHAQKFSCFCSMDVKDDRNNCP